MSREDAVTSKRTRRLGAEKARAAKLERDGSTHIPIPHVVLDSPGYRRASHKARALLIDLAGYLFRPGGHGLPNGGLMIERDEFAERGWKSISTLNKACKELLELGLLAMTRQGGKKMPSLYAVTWLSLQVGTPKYVLDINPDAWNKVHRGAYMRPDLCVPTSADRPDRAVKAREARSRNAAARRIAKSGLLDSDARDGCGLLDRHQPAVFGLSDSPNSAVLGAFSGLPDSLSIERCHLRAPVVASAPPSPSQPTTTAAPPPPPVAPALPALRAWVLPPGLASATTSTLTPTEPISP